VNKFLDPRRDDAVLPSPAAGELEAIIAGGRDHVDGARELLERAAIQQHRLLLQAPALPA
jgi:hypothetical protein